MVKATASKGVILATGDHGSNQEIVAHYCPEVIANNIASLWMNFDVEGNPTNTGDGLKLGAWAGAAIQQHHAPPIGRESRSSVHRHTHTTPSHRKPAETRSSEHAPGTSPATTVACYNRPTPIPPSPLAQGANTAWPHTRASANRSP